MAEIPLVKVRYADSFAQVLNRLGAPTERLLNKVNLSEEMLTIAGGYMPVRQLWEFTALTAEYTGLSNIGLMSGMTPLEKHSRFGQNLFCTPTLYQAIMMFCKTARTELTNVDFHIREETGKFWFCRAPVEGSENEVRQVESYQIGMMVQVIRWAAGLGWKPRELRLQSPDARSLLDVEMFSNTNIHTGFNQLALEVPLGLLQLPLLQAADSPEEGQSQPGQSQALLGEVDFKTAIKEVILTHIRSHHGNIKDVALSLDMSVRTLQRHLTNSGTTFSQILDQTRVQAATFLLEDMDLRISDIAYELDYSEGVHFSRAFKRVTGVTPSQYRAYR